MKHYKRIVYAGLGLSIVAVFGTVNDFLFRPIFLPERLPAAYLPPIAYSVFFLLFYLFFAMIFAVFLSSEKLKRRIWAPLSVLLLGTLWCVLFFLCGLDDVGCGVLFIAFCLLCYVVALAVSESAPAAVIGLPMLILYAFLLGNAILLAVFSE